MSYKQYNQTQTLCQFLLRNATLARYVPSPCVCVCASVTRRYCVKTAKRRISLQVACITSVVGLRFGPPKNFGVASPMRIKFMKLYGRPPLALAGFLVLILSNLPLNELMLPTSTVSWSKLFHLFTTLCEKKYLLTSLTLCRNCSQQSVS